MRHGDTALSIYDSQQGASIVKTVDDLLSQIEKKGSISSSVMATYLASDSVVKGLVGLLDAIYPLLSTMPGSKPLFDAMLEIAVSLSAMGLYTRAADALTLAFNPHLYSDYVTYIIPWPPDAKPTRFAIGVRDYATHILAIEYGGGRRDGRIDWLIESIINSYVVFISPCLDCSEIIPTIEPRGGDAAWSDDAGDDATPVFESVPRVKAGGAAEFMKTIIDKVLETGDLYTLVQYTFMTPPLSSRTKNVRTFPVFKPACAARVEFEKKRLYTEVRLEDVSAGFEWRLAAWLVTGSDGVPVLHVAPLEPPRRREARG